MPTSFPIQDEYRWGNSVSTRVRRKGTQPGSNSRKHVEKEKTKHEGQDNSVMAEAPPTCNPANARKVG